MPKHNKIYFRILRKLAMRKDTSMYIAYAKPKIQKRERERRAMKKDVFVQSLKFCYLDQWDKIQKQKVEKGVKKMVKSSTQNPPKLNSKRQKLTTDQINPYIEEKARKRVPGSKLPCMTAV